MLSHLDLSNNCLQGGGVAHLAVGIRACQKLTRLDLSQNDVDDMGGKTLLDAVLCCEKVECLELCENDLGRPLTIVSLAALPMSEMHRQPWETWPVRQSLHCAFYADMVKQATRLLQSSRIGSGEMETANSLASIYAPIASPGQPSSSSRVFWQQLLALTLEYDATSKGADALAEMLAAWTEFGLPTTLKSLNLENNCLDQVTRACILSSTQTDNAQRLVVLLGSASVCSAEVTYTCIRALRARAVVTLQMVRSTQAAKSRLHEVQGSVVVSTRNFSQ